MLAISLVSIILPVTLMFINATLFKKNQNSREKVSPFECGFDPSTLPRNPFSLKFYLIAIIFLIFDIEIALILPLPLMTYLGGEISMSILFSYFMFILLMGVLYEWKEGSLNWIN